jgi:hypothetical protein
MLLRKAQGGTTVNWRGTSYTWDEDGDVTDVPAELGEELLAIQGGGYSEAGNEPAPAGDGGSGDGRPDEGEDAAKVTEPAPDGENKVTEPGPGTRRGGGRRKTAVEE